MKYSLELKVGALVVASLGLLAGFVAMLGGFSFGSMLHFYVDFGFSGNIHEGAPVKISGIKVGKVEKIQFLAGEIDPQLGRPVQVRLTVQVEERVRNAIHDDAQFFVNTQGVLGEQYLEIEPGRNTNSAVAPFSKWRGTDPPRSDLIIARLYEFLDSVTRLLQEDKELLRDLLRSSAKVARSLDKLLGDNETEVKKILANVDRLTAESAELVAKLEKGVGSGEEIRKILSHVEAISAELHNDLSPLLQKTKRALDGVGDVAALLGPDEKKKLVRALDDLLALSAKANSLASDTQTLLQDVRRGKGTAGALLVDPQIYDDLRELTRDLKRHPWKFFWKE
ncbi:MAG TPA: MlaD family protein [Pseudomonadota bacterium]|jgi:phospholipid/cholesterol/gamma-HCH transport system substrate-binding protein|nr:MlaD family protein [Pseudomonadota bacterium]